MKLFECQHCGQPLYFENTRCESCGHKLGYLPDKAIVTALEEENGAWRALAAARIERGQTSPLRSISIRTMLALIVLWPRGAWCGEEAGWVGLDPTNAILASDDHVVLAIGRDYADIAPLDGVIIAAGGQSLEVSVQVTPVG